MQNKTEKNKRSSVVKKISDINKRVMAVFLAAVLSLGAAIPTMVANAPEAEAAETASYSSYIQFTGDRVDSYVFSAGGSASGAIGTCCDPENTVSTGTAGITKIGNNTRMARLAYWFYTNGWDPRQGDIYYNSYRRGRIMACCMFYAVVAEQYGAGKWYTLDDVYRIEIARMSSNNWADCMEIYDYALSAVSKAPDSFAVYYLDTYGAGAQDGIVWKHVPPGSARIKKKSTAASTASLPGYNSFKGIQYTLYKSNKSTRVGTFTLRKDGTSNVISNLAPGTYYIKETKTNAYYKLDSTWRKVTITSNTTKTFTFSDVPEYSTAKIIKKEQDGEVIPSGVHFTFTFVNKNNSQLKYTLTVDGNDTTAPSGSRTVPAGTYTVTETKVTVDGDDDMGTEAAKWKNVTGKATLKVAPKKTAAITWINKWENENVLSVSKSTDDGGDLEGFRFRVEGILFNQGTITANQIAETANPQLTLTTEDYTAGDWTVNADDVDALNNDAANIRRGDKTVRMTTTLTHKPVTSQTPAEIVAAIDPVPTTAGTGTISSGTNISYNSKYYKAVNNVEYAYAFKEEGTVFDAEGTAANIVALLEDNTKFNVIDMSNVVVTLPVPINLKSVVYEDEEYVSKIENPTEQTVTEDLYTIKYNKFDWCGASTLYKDIYTGNEYTILTTDESGRAMWDNTGGKKPVIDKGITPGRFTVTEMMTTEQAARYHQPTAQTKTIQKDEEGNFDFKFENIARRTKVKLKKTSPNGVIEDIAFKLTGTTAYGEKIQSEDPETGEITDGLIAYTDENGVIDFGELHRGHYVVEEIGFDKTLYINNHPLAGHEKPAIEFDVTGDEDQEIVIDFDNLPITSLYLTKIDGDTTVFLPNAEFELYEKSGSEEELVARFQVVENDDHTAGINLLWVHEDRNITGKMVKTIFENVPAADEGDPDAIADDIIPSGGNSGNNDGNTGDSENTGNEDGDDSDDDPDPTELNWAKLQNLTIGQEYVLKETKAPKGYTKAQPITFTFRDNDKVICENYIPQISTVATDADTNSHVAKADDDVTIRDTVSYQHLEPNTTYTMKGMIAYVPESALDDVKWFEDNGKPVAVEKTFTTNSAGTATETENPEDMVVMDFTFNGSKLAGKSLVVYEKCYQDKNLIASHTVPLDKSQSIYFPKVDTVAKRTTKESTHKITDTVSMENLTPGQEYTLTGTLMDKETGEPFMIDGQPVTSEPLVFTAEKANEEQEIVFNFTAENLKNRTGVAFEELLVNGKVVAEHKDIDDEEQTVKWPSPSYTMYKVRNENAPKASKGKYGFIWGDTVTYTVVIQNTGNCDLRMDVSDSYKKADYFTLPKVVSVKNATQNSISEDKNVVNITVKAGETAKVIYEATINNGTPEYLAAAAKDSDSLKGKADCNRADKDNIPDDKDGYVNIAKTENVQYQDPDDEDKPWEDYPDGEKHDDAQTPVQTPHIKTVATGKATEEHTTMKGDTVIVDTVTYTGLRKGVKYTLKGELKDKATKKTVATAEKTFKANGSEVKLEFAFKATGNATYVAFEEVYLDGTLIAEHKDINDKDQSVYVPEIRTTANLSNTTVIDKVDYENLIPGKTYVMRGYLVNSKSKKLNKSDGAIKFTPKERNGYVLVELPIKYSFGNLSGEKLVAFEELYIVNAKGKEVRVAEHKDLNDKNQTVTVKYSKSNPKTGDIPILPIGGGILLAAGIALIVYKRKTT